MPCLKYAAHPSHNNTAEHFYVLSYRHTFSITASTYSNLRRHFIGPNCVRVNTVAMETPTMRYLSIVYRHVDVNNMKLSSFAQECFYDEFMSPATIKLRQAIT